MNRIAVLGSTGSIGTRCLEVIAAHRDRMSLTAITAHRSWQALGEQSRMFEPRWAVLGDGTLRETVPRDAFSPRTELLFGPDAIERVAGSPDVDVVVVAIVGAAGLHGTWAALEAGKRVCIANKETLVVAGPLVIKLAAERGAELLPVDSEHSAVFQAMQAGRRAEVRRVI
ncbi:MAG TPA: 1-deoxy-D-xylulose-5-phosphate reductoisomerase, partial [Planctomycetaceae bacterium]|nr:1-deoxy-D-xylulose-5-phosphate reductoisomerase [Planctomycetaceae bacterium]